MRSARAPRARSEAANPPRRNDPYMMCVLDNQQQSWSYPAVQYAAQYGDDGAPCPSDDMFQQCPSMPYYDNQQYYYDGYGYGACQEGIDTVSGHGGAGWCGAQHPPCDQRIAQAVEGGARRAQQRRRGKGACQHGQPAWQQQDVAQKLADERYWSAVRDEVRLATAGGTHKGLSRVLGDFSHRAVPSAAARNNVPAGPDGKFAHQLATCVRFTALVEMPLVRDLETPQPRWRPNQPGWVRVFVGQCPQEYFPFKLGAVVRQLVFADVPQVFCAEVEISSRQETAQTAALFLDGPDQNAAPLFSLEQGKDKDGRVTFHISAPAERARELLSLSGRVLCHPEHVTEHSVKFEEEDAVRGTSELHVFLRGVEEWQRTVGITGRPLKPLTFRPSRSRRN